MSSLAPLADGSDLAERYARDGYVSPLDVLDAAEVGRLRAAYDALEAAERDADGIAWHKKLQGRHFDQRFVWEAAVDPRVLDLASAVLGEDLLLMSTHFFCKYPAADADGHFVAWHQDTAYWGLEPATALTVWLAIDDSNPDNGCMQVVAGSHHGGITAHGKSSRANNLLASNQAIDEAAIDPAAVVALELRPGQASLHHGRIVHGSEPNRSSARRCGLTLRYISPDVRQARPNNVGGWWRPVLVRGSDRHGHFAHTPAPF